MDGRLSAETYRAALARAHEHALDWLDSLDTRTVTPRASIDEVAGDLGTELPDGPTSPEDVIDLLAAAAGPGLTAMQSGRFFGFVFSSTVQRQRLPKAVFKQLEATIGREHELADRGGEGRVAHVRPTRKAPMS